MTRVKQQRIDPLLEEELINIKQEMEEMIGIPISLREASKILAMRIRRRQSKGVRQREEILV